MNRISRGKVLRYGIFFFSVGIFCMLINVPIVRILGSLEIFIGSFSLIVYNWEKYNYLKLLHNILLQKGIKVSFKKHKFICILLCVSLFLCNSFSWGFLLFLGVVSKLVFNVVGGVFILLLLPLASSPDEIEKRLANANAEELFNQLNKCNDEVDY